MMDNRESLVASIRLTGTVQDQLEIG